MLSRTIAFLLGIVALYRLPQLPDPGLFLLLGLFAIAWRRYPLIPNSHWIPLFFLLGFTWSALDAAQRLSPALPDEAEGVPVVVTGCVASLPQHDGRVLRFVLQLESGRTLAGEPLELPRVLRLSWYNVTATQVEPGQRWQLRVKLKRPHSMRNPGGFDYDKWLFTKGIGATGYVRSRGDNRLLAQEVAGYRLLRIRYAIRQQLHQVLQGRALAGVVSALAIGERSGISDRQWQVLMATGTNHLVAISGLHIGLVAGLLFWFSMAAWRWCPRCCLLLPAPRAAALVAMSAAVGYAALAGFSIPTQRAMIMLAIVLGGIWWQRPLRPGRVLMLALWAVLLHDPVSVLSAGFWLSFSAVAWIAYGMRGRVGQGGLWWRWGRVQWLLALGLLPLLLLFFQQGSLAAPLANLVAVPWVSLVVVPLTLAGVVTLLLLPSVGALLLQLAAAAMEGLWPLLKWLSEAVPVLPAAATPWTLLPATVGLLWLLAPRGWPLRPAGVLLLLPLLLVHPASPPQGVARVALLDVGQGLAVVVQTQRHTLVFDTGPRFPSGFNTGEAVVLPFLRQQGIGRIDTLVVSHRGNDHSGGARSVLESVPVQRVLSSIRHDRWIHHESCRRGQQWRWDGVEFRLLHPTANGKEGSGNERSCVLKVTAGSESLLLTADIEAGAEDELLNSGETLGADVLQVPHHGSTTSSTPAFIEAVAPKVALFSVGYRNRYGFPRPEVVERYRQAGASLYRTDRGGALLFELGRGDIRVHAWRFEQRKLWHM